MLKVAVFDTKQYDIPGLERYGKENDISFKFNNFNYITDSQNHLELDTDSVKLLYIIGSTVTAFDTWNSYSGEYLLFGKIS